MGKKRKKGFVPKGTKKKQTDIEKIDMPIAIFDENDYVIFNTKLTLKEFEELEKILHADDNDFETLNNEELPQ